MARLKPSTWSLIAAAAVAAFLLLVFPIRLSPEHALSLAALPASAVALLAGALPGGIVAALTALAALPLHALAPDLGVLLLAVPLLGLVHRRYVHPALPCLLLPVVAASAAALFAGADALAVAVVAALQAAATVIAAYAVALATTVHVPRARGGWAGRPLTHRLFVTFAFVTTLLTVGMGVLAARHLQERQAQTSLASLRLLALEIAESSQVLLEAYGRALMAFGSTLQHADLSRHSAQLSRLVDAYTAGQTEFQTVVVARNDGQVLAAAATRRSFEPHRVIGQFLNPRDDIKGALEARGPYLSNTFRRRGFGDDVLVAISAPVILGARATGVIEGSLDLTKLTSALDRASTRSNLDIVLVDRVGHVVAARGAHRPGPGTEYRPPVDAGPEAAAVDAAFRGEPRGKSIATSVQLPGHGWTVHVAQPVATLMPAFERQVHRVVRDTGLVLFGLILLSIPFAAALARPLGEFSRALAGESDAESRRLLRSVRGAPHEVRRFALELVRAQRRQRRGLRRQQQLVHEKDALNLELQRLNVELDQKVEARTRVLAERKRQLRSSESRWRTMAEIAPDAVVVIDEANVIEFVNTVLLDLTGYESNLLIGQSLDTLIPERFRERHREGLQRHLQSRGTHGTRLSFEGAVLARDDTEIPVEIAFGEYVLEGHRYFVGYLRNIAARKTHEAEVVRARDAAEAANRSKDAFLTTMTHEIRTPLHGLIGTLELLSRDALDARAAYRVGIARNSARALLQIANDVLDLSGIEAGRVRIERTAFDLQELVSAISASFEPEANDRGLRLEHAFEDDVPTLVVGDPLRLRQILGNLLNNALKFTARGRVLLRVWRDTDSVVFFDVADTGVGVPRDKRDHIFDRFAQADDERTRRFGGAGLGLAISRLLARAMGGELVLADTGPLGSTFRLSLPLPVAEEVAVETGGTTSARNLRFDTVTSPRVLVVDDNPANRYVVEAYLQELGAVAVLAGSADAGLAELRHDRFDLVLMDVQMPGKDGYQATREIRHELKLDLPVVAMTANANVAERARCEAAGMNDLLVKPFDDVALLERLVRNLHARAHEQRSLRDASGRHRTPSEEPLLDLEGAESIARRFAGRPATLRKLYMALQEGVAMHLEAIQSSRQSSPGDLADPLHALKGAAGMYGARRLHGLAAALEAEVLRGGSVEDLGHSLDRIERVGRLTIAAVNTLLDEIAATEEDAREPR